MAKKKPARNRASTRSDTSSARGRRSSGSGARSDNSTANSSGPSTGRGGKRARPSTSEPSSPRGRTSGTSKSRTTKSKTRGAPDRPDKSSAGSSPRKRRGPGGNHPPAGRPGRKTRVKDSIEKTIRSATTRSKAPESKGPPRLQKVLADAGIASRRECEQLIEEGRVEVDRAVVTTLGVRVDPDRQEIRLDGEVVTIARRLYFAVNKPTGVVSTNNDPDGRMRVIDLVGGNQRLFTVGRLDKSSEGLIIVTNDGELAQQLTHPKFGVEKKYLVQVQGAPSPAELNKLTRGVRLAEGVAKAKSIRIKKRYRNSTDLEMVLEEGRNREIRRLLARIGHKVTRLKRTAIGPFKLGNLPTGYVHRLGPREVQELRRAIRQPH